MTFCSYPNSNPNPNPNPQIALINSKKSYVRYISHELRTPINTVYLGLKLITKQLKNSNDPKDSENYDTLCDVNLSCMAAMDILNDLLCYEKLESGILELHKQEMFILPFLSQSVALFSVQARECDVALTILTETTDEDRKAASNGNQVTLPLYPNHDSNCKPNHTLNHTLSHKCTHNPNLINLTLALILSIIPGDPILAAT
jgi:signal transduction histidine kinase